MLEYFTGDKVSDGHNPDTPGKRNPDTITDSAIIQKSADRIHN